MPDRVGKGCDKNDAVNRPDGSIEHPLSGQPKHEMTGGNMFVAYVLASTVAGSPNYDALNQALLDQGPGVLTLDLSQGETLDANALLSGVARAQEQLVNAASIENVTYQSSTGELSFRIQNNTGHKLISGFPEGRRMFINIKAFSDSSLIAEINPYDDTVCTLKGLSAEYSPSSPALDAYESHLDALVYETHPSSDLTGEAETFHMVLATGRYKDNRIPPKGFRIDQAAARLAQPVWQGELREDYFTPDEYAGGYDDIIVSLPPSADRIEISLYYQTTSREFIEFLRDEINGEGTTLTSPTGAGATVAYTIQTDPFFDQLKAWGDTLWQIWDHNKQVPGAAPVLMTEYIWTP